MNVYIVKVKMKWYMRNKKQLQRTGYIKIFFFPISLKIEQKL